jgi:hypothetical protein
LDKQKSQITIMEDYFAVTPEDAKEITGCSFAAEDLNSKKLAFVIRLLEIKTNQANSMKGTIETLKERLSIYESMTTASEQSKTINKRFISECSRTFLRVVS